MRIGLVPERGRSSQSTGTGTGTGARGRGGGWLDADSVIRRKASESSSREPGAVTGGRAQVADAYRAYRDRITDLPRLLASQGIVLHSGRNLIKKVTLTSPDCEPLEVAVKAFKTPAWPRGFVYAHLRPSKARRCMIYAQKLLELGISTPDPVACIEYTETGFLRESYYVCRYWPADVDLMELLYKGAPGGPDTDTLLEQLARFTYLQHQHGVLHLDYNPGNILASTRRGAIDLSLVDLNRLRFRQPDLDDRISGLVRLTTRAPCLRTIGRKYAELHGAEPESFCRRLEDAQARFRRRRRAMKHLKSLFRHGS